MNDWSRIILSIVIAIILVSVLQKMFFTASSQEHFADTISAAGGNNVVTTDADGNFSSFPFPKGIIVMWSGQLTSIPDGWALCDGSKDTPDLRGRFVMGSNPSDSSTSDKDSADVILAARPHKSKGGEQSHKLTIDEMPKHKHEMKYEAANYKNGGGDGRFAMGAGCDSGDRCGQSDQWSIEKGGDKPHNIIPPYYALAFIMKL